MSCLHDEIDPDFRSNFPENSKKPSLPSYRDLAMPLRTSLRARRTIQSFSFHPERDPCVL
jgi:hypothetical protein